MTTFDDKIKSLLQQSALQYIIYKENEDSERIEKLNLFARKLLQKEFVIGFAGHFSAGKSSMINALSGESILATSPIPTSANIVKVHKSDEDFAILYLHNEKPVKFEAGYDIKQVKELSKNGELVSEKEIRHDFYYPQEGIIVEGTEEVSEGITLPENKVKFIPPQVTTDTETMNVRRKIAENNPSSYNP